MEKLPKRLQAVVSLIPPCKLVADIGTDHAKIPISLIQSGITSKVIASDIHQGPFQKAKAVICLQGLEEQIDLRLGNGLKVLQPGEAEVIVISGLGGFTIIDIFQESPEILETAETLVLSPASHEGDVRRWLREKGWGIEKEDLVEDQGRIYQIIQLANRGWVEEERWTELEYEVGPMIIREKHPLLKEYLQRKLKKYVQAVQGLNCSQSRESLEKAEALSDKIEEILQLLASYK